MTLESFIKQCPFLTDRLLSNVISWNNIFSISYFEFRNTLKNIAAANLENVKNIKGFVDAKSWNTVPDDAYLLPVDDDDWFHPDIVSNIEAHHKDFSCYYWRHSIIGFTPSLNDHQGLKEFGCCFGTNSYMLQRKIATIGLLEDHYSNSKTPGSLPLELQLNLTNKTMASTLNILEEISLIDTQLVGMIEPIIPEHFLWAKPYIEATTQLYRSMKLLKLFI